MVREGIQAQQPKQAGLAALGTFSLEPILPVYVMILGNRSC
jgi:hypothetical protein